jgi:hypothetical protein
MASVARFILARGLNGTGAAPIYQTSTNMTGGRNDAATLRLINSLVFAESKSVRTSTIILAVFNILASGATAASILYDCYWASKRCNPKFKASWVVVIPMILKCADKQLGNFACRRFIQQRLSH